LEHIENIVPVLFSGQAISTLVSSCGKIERF
jgi:hypothetical protein